MAWATARPRALAPGHAPWRVTRRNAVCRATTPETPASRLRQSLTKPGCLVMPSVYDALGAKLVQRSGAFECAFMSGYGVALSRLGEPDVGLVSFAEVVDAGKHVCRAAGDVPVVGDGDTGFGGVANVRRSVFEFHRAGFAAISIEDQVFPKRCAFAQGVKVVDRLEAVARLKAALDARDEIRAKGGDILVIGRTDCRLADNVDDGLREALWRCAAFEELGADIVYFEAPQSVSEMRALNERKKQGGAFTMLAQVEKADEGGTVLSAKQCAELGYDAALFGLTLINASAAAMQSALAGMSQSAQSGLAAEHPKCGDGSLGSLLNFAELNEIAGMPAHRQLEQKYLPANFQSFADGIGAVGMDGEGGRKGGIVL
jgi:2-methylisocitrate lyase-like PEP mutase family enzyme